VLCSHYSSMWPQKLVRERLVTQRILYVGDHVPSFFAIGYGPQVLRAVLRSTAPQAISSPVGIAIGRDAAVEVRARRQVSIRVVGVAFRLPQRQRAPALVVAVARRVTVLFAEKAENCG